MAILWFLCVLFSLIGVAISQPATGTPAPSPLGFDSAPASVSDSPSPASAPQAPDPNDGKTNGGVTTVASAPPEQGITTPLPTTSMGFQSPPTSVTDSPTTTSVPQTSTSNGDKTSRGAATTAPAPTQPVTGTPSPTQLGFQSAPSPVPERPKTTRETQKPTSNANKPTGGVATTAPAPTPEPITAPPLTFGGTSSTTTDTSNSHTSALDDGSQDEGATSGSSAAAAKAETTTTNGWKEKYESFESECGGQECSDDCMTTLVALVYNIPDNTADDGVNYYQMLVDILQGCSSSVSSVNDDLGSVRSDGSSSAHRQSSSSGHSTTGSVSSSSAFNIDGAGSDNTGDGDFGADSNSGSSKSPRAVVVPVVTGIVALLLSVGH